MSEAKKVDSDKQGSSDSSSESKLSKAYVFTAYHLKGDKPIGELEPVLNTVVLTADPAKSKYDKSKPIVLKTNKNGLLYKISEKTEVVKDNKSAPNEDGDGSDSGTQTIDFVSMPSYLETASVFHARTDESKPIIVPPADAVSFIAASKQDGKSWMEEMIEMAKASNASVQPLVLQDISLTQLREPKEDDVSDEELAYKEWYSDERIKYQSDPKRRLKGYVIPKVRAMVLTINKDLPVDIPIAFEF